MSTRHMRKLLGSTALPPPDESDDDDFVPLYAKKQGGTYAALELDSAPDPEVEENIIETEEPECLNVDKKKKRNNRKNKKGKSNTFDMDEIDKSVREVNALLGEPKPQQESQKKDKRLEEENMLFSVQQKNLDSNNEMVRIFGPEDDEDEIRRQRLRKMKYQKNIVTQNMYAFTKHGLSMSIKNSDKDVTYFVFDHNKEYRNLHQVFLETIKSAQTVGGMAQIDFLFNEMHVEALLEVADRYFMVEENSRANEVIEQAIAYMQFVAHPCFSLTGRRSRLEYKYLENRPFHVALLKFAHLLSNRACHRTALEVVKALLNLDPNDPLAVIFIIDTFAIRSREHKWLYDSVDYWNRNRDGEFMFNLQYSQAMCCYHLSKAKNRKVTPEEANDRLQKTLLRFPFVLIKLIESCNQAVPEEIRKCKFFNEFASLSTPQALKDLMNLYIKFTWARWREQPVLEWLTANATEVIHKLQNNIIDEKSTMADVQNRSRLFQKWPEEIIRHLCIIKPMSNLIVEGAVPEVPSYPLRTNPCPPSNTVNRYNYALQRQGNMEFLQGLLRTIRPTFDNDAQN
ncbi:unnamed protein product [Pieris macdunnoughi]|uniref:Transcription factor 25 n=1 Tax=Pieris macdunnoughi TaxID=345717 RepID=A0A821SET2_9NEOP|nr:unnamed protein product [Pieris macdunnoughi]